MAGKSKGVAARIVTKYPKALYTHCASHWLNLCVMKCCSLREITNTMEIADSVSRFFTNSPKMQLSLESWIDQIVPPNRGVGSSFDVGGLTTPAPEYCVAIRQMSISVFLLT